MSEKFPLEWPKELKKTKQRIDIYDALCDAEKPLSVQEISTKLASIGNPIWLSTIYRVLETMLEHGIVQRSAVHESGIALYEIGDKHRHYAVCIDCKRVIELAGCPIESVLPDLHEKSFHVMGHKLQISGLCVDCYIKNQQD